MKKNVLILVATACMATTLGVLVSSRLNARSLNQKADMQPDLNGELSQRSPGSLPIAKAGTTVPVSKILSQLKGKTAVPIFIPSQLPFSDKVYFSSEGKPNGYTISIGYTPNCQATACSIGEIRAEKGGEFSQKMEGVTKTLKNIQLAGGIKGVFHNGCGAYCTASAEWKHQGVLYVVAIKNGREADAIAIANSAIQAGRR